MNGRELVMQKQVVQIALEAIGGPLDGQMVWVRPGQRELVHASRWDDDAKGRWHRYVSKLFDDGMFMVYQGVMGE